jgi:hypothetical protein
MLNEMLRCDVMCDAMLLRRAARDLWNLKGGARDLWHGSRGAAGIVGGSYTPVTSTADDAVHSSERWAREAIARMRAMRCVARVCPCM